MRRIGGLLLLGAIVATTALAVPAQASNRDVLYTRGNQPLGMSYGVWAAQWWSWIYGLTRHNVPILKEGSVDCSLAQRKHPLADQVWFLGGVNNPTGVTTRSCTVPSNVSLFVPIIDASCWYLTDTPEKKLQACVQHFADYGSATATLDGVPIDTTHYRVVSPKLQFFANPRGLIRRPDLPTHLALAANGYYLFLRPLAPGDHVLHFTGAATRPVFIQDITYDLHVVDAGSLVLDPAALDAS